MKKYQIIYADPPWEMQGGVYNPKYPTMKIGDICNLPIGDLSDNNCALFLWVLNSRLQEGLDVMKSWGFTYKTIAFCWVKTSQKTGMPNCRVGTFTLGGIEICLLGLKGKLKREMLNIRQVLLQPRGVHSQKPEKIRNDIYSLYGDLPRIELFARTKTEGWDVWGNEVESDIKL
jgi:site-specific DNA-methyltransferase (adenine-specific)